MKKNVVCLFLFFISITPVIAQDKSDEAAIKTVITRLFDGMRSSDTVQIRSAFSSQATMETIIKNKEGVPVNRRESLDSFIKSIGAPHPEVYDERIQFSHIHVEGPLASVWTPYLFYVGEKFSHCGVNSFQLLKGASGWKIIYLIDTRRKDNCL